MKLVYTHHNAMLVGIIEGRLTLAGIDCELRNANTMGGAGELPPTDLWPELWVPTGEATRAEALIKQIQEEDQAPAWHCAKCGEDNEPSFEFCWRCQSNAPVSRSHSA